MRRMRQRNAGCAAKRTMPRSGLLVGGRRAGDGERGDRGKVFGVVLLSKKLFQISSGASQSGFQVHWDWTFLFPLCTRLRYEKNMRIVGLTSHSICSIPVGWGFSWRIVRKVRTDQTSRGSGFRGGLGGKLHHIYTKTITTNNNNNKQTNKQQTTNNKQQTTATHTATHTHAATHTATRTQQHTHAATHTT